MLGFFVGFFTGFGLAFIIISAVYLERYDEEKEK